VKLDEAGEDVTCWPVPFVDHATSIAATASIPARIEWSETMSEDNTLVSTAPRAAEASGYDAARRGAAFFDRADRAFIVVSGTDRLPYLQGLLTNDVASLKAGEGCYAAYLTPQGRMIADLWVYELGDVILLVMSRDVKDTVLTKLDQFIFTEDVQLGDVSSTFASVAIVGPGAAAVTTQILRGVPLETLASLGEHGNVRAEFAGAAAIVARVTDTGEPGYDLFVETLQGESLKAALRAKGAQELDPPTVETLRIEAGMPKFHRDMDEDTIPLEAGIESRAISLTKGCYVGQEVIIRVLHRGHGRVARRLVGLTLDGDAIPRPAAAVHSGDRQIGHVTSSVRSPALQRPVALAYVHRDFVAEGTHVTVDGSPATVTALPFVPRQF
jgi:folate-binding protein YgfZ